MCLRACVCDCVERVREEGGDFDLKTELNVPFSKNKTPESHVSCHLSCSISTLESRPRIRQVTPPVSFEIIQLRTGKDEKSL